ncbi:DUF309 domain-containing protein [Streptomyces sp. NPDC059637]|uniref:DUF309 domain-containing protein n=1 Tax=Streptomyces sp. NPDC059637 TaxID=3347752 RepID=UPI00367A9A9E
MSDERGREGGDPACWLDRVCPECGRVREEPPGRACGNCGVLPEDDGPGTVDADADGDGAAGVGTAYDGTAYDGTAYDGAAYGATGAGSPGRGAAARPPAADRGRGRERERDRDPSGRARNARPRDGLGRPLPYGSPGVPRLPEGVVRSPQEALAEAQRLLDDGMPFHAHEVLEDAWKSSPEPERALWRGLAQFAVGLTHVLRGNRAGAGALLGRAVENVAPYQERPPHGIDVAGLTRWSQRLLEELGSAGPRGGAVDADLTAPPALRADGGGRSPAS